MEVFWFRLSVRQIFCMCLSSMLISLLKQVAEPMLEARVFLEVALPTIVQILRKVANASVKSLDLCTAWLSKDADRGRPLMINKCANNPMINFGMYHPYKLSKGWKSWSDMFDFVTYSTKVSSQADIRTQRRLI